MDKTTDSKMGLERRMELTKAFLPTGEYTLALTRSFAQLPVSFLGQQSSCVSTAARLALNRARIDIVPSSATYADVACALNALFWRARSIADPGAREEELLLVSRLTSEFLKPVCLFSSSYMRDIKKDHMVKERPSSAPLASVKTVPNKQRRATYTQVAMQINKRYAGLEGPQRHIRAFVLGMHLFVKDAYDCAAGVADARRLERARSWMTRHLDENCSLFQVPYDSGGLAYEDPLAWQDLMRAAFITPFALLRETPEAQPQVTGPFGPNGPTGTE